MVATEDWGQGLRGKQIGPGSKGLAALSFNSLKRGETRRTAAEEILRSAEKRFAQDDAVG